MQIINFDETHIKEAAGLAFADYEEERRQVPSLPAFHGVWNLREYAENKMGVAAFENGEMKGFLCGCTPFDNAFGSTDVRGVFSPMGAHGAVRDHRADIYAALYQAVAEKWIRAGAVSHALCLYAYDMELQRQFYLYGFGCRCMDGIRRLDGEGQNSGRVRSGTAGGFADAGYEYVELAQDESGEAFRLVHAMYESHRETPFFLNRRPPEKAEFLQECADEGIRFFGVRHNGRLCAVSGIGRTGETFLSEREDYLHIVAAYCLPEYRGGGLYRKLTDYVASVLAAEGGGFLGVDFESINPAAYGFWRKDFDIYTHGVVRRVDERILR